MTSNIPTALRVKPIYPVYRVDNERFRIGAQLGITAEFEDPSQEVWTLVKLLDGRPLARVLEAMRDRFPNLSEQDIREGIMTLDKEGFLEAVSPEGVTDDDIDSRYLPNIHYFSKFTSIDTNRYMPHHRLRAANILILGLGGGGSNVLTLLAGAGVGRIIAVDYDTVEEGNLGRQFLYREKDIGLPKAEVAARALSEMNHHCKVDPIVQKIKSSTDILPLLEGVDLVVCALDEPPFLAQRWVNAACVRQGLPCVYGVSQVTRGRVFTVIPHTSGCFDCLNIHYSMKDPLFVKQFLGFQASAFSPPSIAYGPGIFLLTGTLADEVVRIVTGYAPPRSVGTQLEVDYESGRAYTLLDWPRLAEHCPTCGLGDEARWEIFSYYTNDR